MSFLVTNFGTVTVPTDLFVAKRCRRVKADNLTVICEPVVQKMWDSQHPIIL
jgi:hypothetical protein